MSDFDLLDLLVQVGRGCGQSQLLVFTDLRTFLLEGPEVPRGGGVLSLILQPHPLVLLIEMVEEILRIIDVFDYISHIVAINLYKNRGQFLEAVGDLPQPGDREEQASNH